MNEKKICLVSKVQNLNLLFFKQTMRHKKFEKNTKICLNEGSNPLIYVKKFSVTIWVIF